MAEERSVVWSNPIPALNWLHSTTFLCDNQHKVPVPEPDNEKGESSFGYHSILLTRKDGHCLEYPINSDACPDEALARALQGRRSEITALELSGTNLTDQGLNYLRGLPLLTKLELDDTQITDAGLQTLAQSGLMQLQKLNLTCTNVTDAGIVWLNLISSLDHLRLEHTGITNETLKSLRTTKIAILNVGHTAVNDMGLIWLQDLPNLKVLSLAGTEITDDGLKHVVRCRRLQVLNLERARGLSEIAVARLKRKMPGCLIVKPDGMFLK